MKNIKRNSRIYCQHTPSVIGKNSTAGVTLVALIVTIVVLLILAGISIMAFTGDTGIFNETKGMKNNIEDLQNQTIDDLHSIANELASSGGGALDPDNPDTPDQPDNPTPEGPTISDSTSTSHTATTIDYTWEQINKIAEGIAKSDSVNASTMEVTANVDGTECTIGVGDIATVKYGEEVRRVRVLGFKHDDLVDTTVYGSGITATKASISFEFYDFMTGYKRMNSSSINTGGWAAIEMRKDLNGYTTSDDAQSGSIGGLGVNLSNMEYIKQVIKKYIKSNSSASSVTTCNDYLWLLAASEIVPKNSDSTRYGVAITSEGNQYKFYQIVNSEWKKSCPEREKFNASGVSGFWWLRSLYYENGGRFCVAGSDGVNGSQTSTYELGVAPGFCI